LLSSAFSDVCDEAGSAPLAGEGDICAAPLLADEGNPSSFDVHETPSSPTIDAGSNALVPASLATDFYGETRIRPRYSRIEGCYEEGYVPAAVVDIGASEATPTFSGTPSCPPPRPMHTPILYPSPFVFPSSSIGAAGQVGLSFAALPGAGTLSVLGTFKLTHAKRERVHGHRRLVKLTETVVYCHATLTTKAPGTAKLTLHPSKRGLAALRSLHKLKLTLSITFTENGQGPSTQTRTLVVRYKAPKHHHR
jgi:hypothetical protein